MMRKFIVILMLLSGYGNAQAASSYTTTVPPNTTDVTIGTANGLSLVGQVLSLQAATNSVPGAMTAADHVLLSTRAPVASPSFTGTVTSGSGHVAITEGTSQTYIGEGSILTTGGGAADTSIRWDGVSGDLIFSAGAVERARIKNSGLFVINSGTNIVYRCTGATNLGMLTTNNLLCTTGYATTSLRLD